MLELAVKADSQIHDITKTAKYFDLNVLGKNPQGAAYNILKSDEHEGQRIRGEALYSGSTGTPVMDNTPAFVECRLLTTVEEGDHSIFIGEVVDAGVIQEYEGYADEVTLLLKDPDEKIVVAVGILFYDN